MALEAFFGRHFGFQRRIACGRRVRMPRANRYIVPGQIYHITHRCHDRAFLLKFGIDRDGYRAWLREGLRRHRVSLLNYCITSNHVHLILHSESAEEVARLMQLVEGCVAQDYNLRKGRSGAWGRPGTDHGK